MELGDILLVAYKTPTGIPYGTLNFKTLMASNPGWSRGASGLSEFGTEQVLQADGSLASCLQWRSACATGGVLLCFVLYAAARL